MEKPLDPILDEIVLRWRKELAASGIKVSLEGLRAFRKDIAGFLMEHPQELLKTSRSREYLVKGVKTHARYVKARAKRRTLFGGGIVTPDVIDTVRANCGPHRWAC